MGLEKRKINRTARTKIIATIGPSSNSYGIIRRMVSAGLNVARLNFSHGTHEDHQKVVDSVRLVNKRYRRRLRVLQDLEGYRIRISRFSKAEYKVLKKNTKVQIVSGEDTGEENIIPFDYRGDLKNISQGQLIYIDDGNIILKAQKTYDKKIIATVVEGGKLKQRKGVNMPGVRIPFSGITPKDIQDLKFGIENSVDYIAQSFVRKPSDVAKIREKIKDTLPKCQIIAKIECREAIRNIDGIIDMADGVMIARGDMGIAVPIYTVPVIQKTIIKKCNRRKKPVITATQMLEHMTEHSRPTRAEVNDVANAIMDGTDFVMLSGETAAGAFPVGSVKMMDRIIKFTETYEGYLSKI